MNATAPDGKTYNGRFFQVTRDTTADTLGPLWDGWGGGPWGGIGWDSWYAGPSFITEYTGKVVANLGAPSGEHMRCKFELARPSSGMAGGGRGHCQMPDGMTIDATFPGAQTELRGVAGAVEMADPQLHGAARERDNPEAMYTLGSRDALATPAPPSANSLAGPQKLEWQ
jgi:hypothetical protein